MRYLLPFLLLFGLSACHDHDSSPQVTNNTLYTIICNDGVEVNRYEHVPYENWSLSVSNRLGVTINGSTYRFVNIGCKIFPEIPK